MLSALLVVIEENNTFNFFIYTFFILINFLIWSVFLIEFVLKCINAQDKKEFFLYNKIDLLSLIPFSIIVYILKVYSIYRFVIIIHILKVIKFSIMMIKFEKRILKQIRNNRLLYLMSITILIIIIGSISISIVEKKSFSDSLWLTIVTITTVGYGDIRVNTEGGRFVSGMLMLIGIGFTSLLTGAITSYFIKNSIKKNNDLEIDKIKRKLDSFDKLTEEDILNIYNKLIDLKNKRD